MAAIEYQLPGTDEMKRHTLSEPLYAFKDETKRYRSESLSGKVHERVVGDIKVSALLPLSEMPKDWRGLGTAQMEARYSPDPGTTISCKLSFHQDWRPGQDPVKIMLIGPETEDLLWE